MIRRRWFCSSARWPGPTGARRPARRSSYTHFFGSIAKWVIEINDPREVPRIMARAFHVARTGAAGPGGGVPAQGHARGRGGHRHGGSLSRGASQSGPGTGPDMVDRVNQAAKPVLLAGSGTQYARARDQLVAFAEKFQLPRGDRVQAPGRVSQHPSPLCRESRQPQQTRQADRARRRRPAADRRVPVSTSRCPATTHCRIPGWQPSRSTPTPATSVRTSARTWPCWRIRARPCQRRWSTTAPAPTRPAPPGSPTITPGNGPTPPRRSAPPARCPWSG